MVLLRHFSFDVTSQHGEDGMIAHLIEALGLRPGLCLEFGAWDGKHLSNTWRLWAQAGWKALLIEADPRRFEALRRLTSGFAGVTCMRELVGSGPESTLDRVVERAGVDTPLEILSVDIDGDDYWVWHDAAVQPAVVVIEYNASFAPEVRYVPPRGRHTGASAAAFVELGSSKGYSLVDLTKTNLVFVKSDLLGRLAVELRPLCDLFDRSLLPIVYSDFSGVHHLIRPAPWGFGGLRADLGVTRVTGRLRRGAVQLGHSLAGKHIPGLSPVARWLRDETSRELLEPTGASSTSTSKPLALLGRFLRGTGGDLAR